MYYACRMCDQKVECRSEPRITSPLYWCKCCKQYRTQKEVTLVGVNDE